jgi:hypothetical protein
LVIAGKVDGPVETTIDTQRAILLGAATGIVASLIYLLFNIILRNNRRR